MELNITNVMQILNDMVEDVDKYYLKFEYDSRTQHFKYTLTLKESYESVISEKVREVHPG